MLNMFHLYIKILLTRLETSTNNNKILSAPESRQCSGQSQYGEQVPGRREGDVARVAGLAPELHVRRCR